MLKIKSRGNRYRSSRRRLARLKVAASVALRGAWVERLEERRLLAATLLTNVLSTVGSNPASVVNVNGTGYLTTLDSNGANSIWKTDGTDAGTSLVIAYTGVSTGPAYLTPSNGKLFYSVAGAVEAPGDTPRALFVTDGTPAGTIQLTSFSYIGSTETGLADVNGTLYFVADQLGEYPELWKSDGTVAGTVQLATWPTGGTGPLAGSLANVNGELFFTVASLTQGPQLWKSNGTAAGTQEVTQINPANASAPLNNLTNLNGTLFFTADDGVHGNELWKSDGTAAGTAMVADINPASADSSPSDLTAANGTLYFSADDGTTGRELWKSDGTSAGTVRVADINPQGGSGGSDGAGSNPANLTSANGTLFFTANDGTHGAELWKTDGSSAGTLQVADIVLGGAGASPANLVAFGNGVLFSANDGTHGTELWKSDGTSAGTVMLQDIWSGAGSSTPADLVNIGGKVIFTASDPLHGQQPWVSDGTSAGTNLVRDLSPTALGTYPSHLLALGDQLIFSLDVGPSTGLWATDGTSAGTVELSAGTRIDTDISPVVVGGQEFFVSRGNLWKTDGTPGGTAMVAQFARIGGEGMVTDLTDVNGRLFFSGSSLLTGQELWTSDGTTSGTYMVADLARGSTDSLPMNLTNVNGTLFFTAGSLLYKTDGTPSGTVPVTGTPMSFNNSEGYFHAYNGLLLFVASPGANSLAFSLWRSDGTKGGTFPIGPGSTLTVRPGAAILNGIEYFGAFDTSGNYSLWRTDGTDAGTAPVKTVGNTNTSAGVPLNPINVNGVLYFNSPDERTLWRSDGTSAGTVPLQTYPQASHNVEGLIHASGTLYFGNNTQIYTSDGTSAGTQLVDISPLNPTTDSSLTAVDGQVFFTGTTSQYSVQLWKLTPPVVNPAAPADPTGLQATAVSGGEVDLNWTSNSNEVGFHIDRSSDPAFGTIDKSWSIADSSLTNYVDTTVQPGVTYYYRVTGYNRGGESAGAIASAGTPATPLAPRGLSVVPFPAHVDLSWLDNSSNETGFRIERSAQPDFSTIDATFTVAANVNSFSDTSVVPTSAYFYRITAYNAAGSSGAAVFRVLTPDLAPTNLIAVGVSTSEIDLQWTTPSTTQLFFNILRSSGGGPFVLVGTIAGNQTSYSDLNLASIGTYTYMVEQTGVWGKSDSAPATATTQPPQLTTLVKQLPNIVDHSPDSSPSAIVTSNGIGYFAADDGIHGSELWRTDGTAAGTHLVKDLNPGVNGSGIVPYSMTDVNGTLYFVAVDPNTQQGIGLWKSNGTAAGTVMVKDLSPSYMTTIHDLTVLNGVLYFRGAGFGSGARTDALWKTDGTAGGTVVVADFPTGGAPGNNFNQLVNANGKLFLSAACPQGGNALYVSDGTAAGTTQVLPSAGTMNIQNLKKVGNGVFFENSVTYKIWYSDGTAANTYEVPNSPPNSNADEHFTDVNGKLFFIAPGTNEPAIWTSDGTAAGTYAVADLPQVNGATVSAVAFNGKYVCAGSNGYTSSALYITDGTPAGTTLLASFTSDSGSAGILQLTIHDGLLYFFAEQPGNLWMLYKSDGTAAGTAPVFTFALPIRPVNLADFGNFVTFAAADGVHGIELWRSDGTTAGTALISDINSTTYNAQPDSMVNAGGTVFFTASPYATYGQIISPQPQQLWKTDGTPGGTMLLATLPVDNLLAVGNDVYFAGRTVASGDELWMSDGTVAGTTMVSDIVPGVGSSSPLPLADLNGTLIFGVPTGTPGDYQLWKSDGTAGGTVQVSTAVLHLYGSLEYRPGPDYVVSQGRFYFVSKSGGAGYELWSTDGTSAGTQMVVDLNPGSAGSNPSDLIDGGSALYFTALDPVNGDTLYKTDGTAAGTVALVAAPAISSMTRDNGQVYFSSADAAQGAELWKTDGTRAGTTMLKDISFGNPYSFLKDFTVVGGAVDFLAVDGTGNNGWLYTTDGTAAGTVPIRSFQDALMGNPVFLANAGGTLFYADGWHLWRSDGTIGGTIQVMELTPSGNAVRPPTFAGSPYAVLGDRLLFSAYHAGFGRELRFASGTIPAAPTGLMLGGGTVAPALALAATSSSPTLSWTNQSTSATGSIVDRSTSPLFTAGLHSFFVAAGISTSTDSTALSGVVYYYRVRAVNAAGLSLPSNIASNASISAVAQVGDGAVQRSLIRTVTLTFSKPVALASGAITLSRRNTGGSGANDGSAPTDLSPDVSFSNPSGDHMTWIISFLSNTAAADASGGLADGIYDLVVHGANVAGNTGGKFADQTITFHRLFGDIDGNGTVNSADYFQFKKAFGTASGSPLYNPAFDFDNNGKISSSDYFRFKNNFGRRFIY